MSDSDDKKIEQKNTFNAPINAQNVNFGVQHTVTFNGAPAAQNDIRAELEALVSQLNEALQKLPDEEKAEGEMIAELTQEALDEASKEEPRKRMLEIKGENLVKAAKNLATVAPIAAQIAITLLKVAAAG